MPVAQAAVMFAPPESPRPPAMTRADLWVVGLLAVFTLIVRGVWFGDPNADIDEQLYSLIGSGMLEGKVPFVDLWDRKPWGLFALFALAHAAGGPGPVAYQALAAVFTLAGGVMTFVLARPLAARWTAAGAGLLTVVLAALFGAHSANSEVFFIPMMLAMALLVRDPDHPRARLRALAAMLIGGAALQVKYTVLPQCLFFGLWALWGEHRRGAGPVRLAGQAALFGLLGLLPTILVGAGYALAGHWQAFVFANFLSFFDRLPSGAGRLHGPIMLLLLPLLGLALLGLNAARRRPAHERRAHAFSGLWLAAALATVFLPSTVYGYYLAALIPPCVLLALPLFARKDPTAFNPLIMAPAALFLALLPSQYGIAQGSRAAAERMAAAIAPHVDGETRCLLVFDGPTALYRLSGSCLPTRFIYPDHLNNALEREALGVRQEDEVARILAGRPPVIVIADTALTPQNPAALGQVRAAIAQGYRPLAQEEFHKRTVRAFVLRD
jgi:hypothetical protein